MTSGLNGTTMVNCEYLFFGSEHNTSSSDCRHADADNKKSISLTIYRSIDLTLSEMFAYNFFFPLPEREHYLIIDNDTITNEMKLYSFCHWLVCELPIVHSFTICDLTSPNRTTSTPVAPPGPPIPEWVIHYLLYCWSDSLVRVKLLINRFDYFKVANRIVQIKNLHSLSLLLDGYLDVDSKKTFDDVVAKNAGNSGQQQPNHQNRPNSSQHQQKRINRSYPVVHLFTTLFTSKTLQEFNFSLSSTLDFSANSWLMADLKLAFAEIILCQYKNPQNTALSLGYCGPVNRMFYDTVKNAVSYVRRALGTCDAATVQLHFPLKRLAVTNVGENNFTTATRELLAPGIITDLQLALPSEETFETLLDLLVPVAPVLARLRVIHCYNDLLLPTAWVESDNDLPSDASGLAPNWCRRIASLYERVKYGQIANFAALKMIRFTGVDVDSSAYTQANINLAQLVLYAHHCVAYTEDYAHWSLLRRIFPNVVHFFNRF